MAFGSAEERIQFEKILPEQVDDADRRQVDALEVLPIGGIEVVEVKEGFGAVFGGQHFQQGARLFDIVPGAVENLLQHRMGLLLLQKQQCAGHGGLMAHLLLEGGCFRRLCVGAAGGAASGGRREGWRLHSPHFLVGARIDATTSRLQNGCQAVRRDQPRPDRWTVTLMRRQVCGDPIQHDAVEQAQFPAAQHPGLDLNVDLGVLEVLDIDEVGEFAFQLVDDERPVVLEPVLELLLDAFRLPAEQRLIHAEQFAGVGSTDV